MLLVFVWQQGKVQGGLWMSQGGGGVRVFGTNGRRAMLLLAAQALRQRIMSTTKQKTKNTGQQYLNIVEALMKDHTARNHSCLRPHFAW